MKSLLTTLAIAVALSTPAMAATKKLPAQINVTAAVAAAKRAVIDKLRDPDSAKWRRAKVDTANGNVCIEVNAKNGFGGYTGFTVVTYNARFHTTTEGGWCFIRSTRAALVNVN